MRGLIESAAATWRRDAAPVAAPRVIEDGLLVTDQASWAWVVLPPAATQLLEDAELEDETLATAQALRTLLPAGAEYHLKILWAPVDPETYRAGWSAPAQPAPGWEFWRELGADRIAANAEAGYYRRRVVLLGMRLPDAASASGRGVRSGLRSPQAAYRAATRRAEAARAAVDAWVARVAESPLAGYAAPAGLLAWSWARQLRGPGLAVPDGQRFAGGALAVLADGEMHPPRGADPSVTCVDLATRRARYVSVLVPAVNGFPVSELEIPGGEWLQAITELDGVEVSLRGTNLGRTGTLTALSAAEKTVSSQEREAGEHGQAPPIEIAAASEALTERRHEVTRRLDVETINHPRWVVAADTPEELATRVETLRTHYAGLVQLIAPAHLQDVLWRELLPGDGVRVPEFGQHQPMRTLAGAWPHGGSAVGDESGPYVGGNLGATPGPVSLHLTSRAQQHVNQPLVVTFTGKSGQGKSTSAAMLLLHTLADGAWGLLLDTKGDLCGVADVAETELGAAVQRVDLLDPAAGGLMDPLRFAEPDEARGLVLDALLGALSREDRNRAEPVLEAAVDAVLAGERSGWSAPAVLDQLKREPEGSLARQLGETLSRRARLPQLRPVLGTADGHSGGLLTGRGLTSLDLAGLDLPRHTPDPDQWSPTQRASMVCFRAAMAYALYQSRRARGVPKWLFLPELHLITAQPDGRAFVEWLARSGRALKTGLLLDSQSAQDLAGLDAVVEQILISAAFRADGHAEQDAQAALLHRPDSGPRLRAAQAGLATGQCVVRDRDNRLGLVEFDRLSTEIAEALSTAAAEDTADDADGEAGGAGAGRSA